MLLNTLERGTARRFRGILHLNCWRLHAISLAFVKKPSNRSVVGFLP